MNALSIDCSVSKITIAAKKDSNLVKLTLNVGIKQSEKLLPAIDFVMKEINLEPKDLDYTAVTSGPGTFTGLRLGMSALKAINLAYNVPVYAIPSLTAYAWPYRTHNSRVLSLIEAKEDEYFYGFYSKDQLLNKEDDQTIENILKQLDSESKTLLCGPGAKKFAERTEEISPLHSVYCFTPEIDACESLFEIAEIMIKENKPSLNDYDGPLYVRKSEAEIVLEQKKSAEKN